MPKLLPFPGPDTRALIHTTVQLYASGKWTRNQLNCQIADTLAAYDITRLNIGNYTVRVAPEPIVTRRGIFPVIILEAHAVAKGPTCPVCDSSKPGYLAGDETVSVMCLECGAIYQFREVKANENT